jgi:hypothetical protein
MWDLNLYSGHPSLLSYPSPCSWTWESSLHCALSCQLCQGGGVYLAAIHTSYPYIMSHLSGLGYRWLGCMCLDTTLCHICLDTCALHDTIAIAWYRLTIFCQPTPRVGHQVEDTHDFCLRGHSSRLSVYGTMRSWIMTLYRIRI